MRSVIRKGLCALLLPAVACAAFMSACSTPSVKHFDVSVLVSGANEYVAENQQYVTADYKNSYHLNPPVGWINDPNGFSEFGGKIHLFYQYHPYSAEWGPMHWGHQTTTDFVKWTLEDVALAPDMEYDASGCFSGTALVDNGVHYLAYTAVTDVQNQGMAYSYDGVTYKKLDELLLSGEDLPEGFSNADFRDPKIFARNGKYYIMCGNKNGGNKQIIIFEAPSVTGPYEYKGVVYSRKDLGGIFECPDFINVDGTDVLIASPQSIHCDKPATFQNADSCVYLLGNLSTNTYKFYQKNGTEMEEFDKGFSFYAPQTVSTSDGRSVLTAWMRSWSEPNVTKVDGWCGAMVLPRELTIRDDHIWQAPVREVYNYLKNEVTAQDLTLENDERELETFAGRTSRITVDIEVGAATEGKAGIEVFKGSDYYTSIYYDAALGQVVFDRNNCGSLMSGKRYAAVEPVNGKISLELFLDNNSVEVFLNGGYYTMTGTAFAPLDCSGVSLFSENCSAHFTNLKKSDVVV